MDSDAHWRKVEGTGRYLMGFLLLGWLVYFFTLVFPHLKEILDRSTAFDTAWFVFQWVSVWMLAGLCFCGALILFARQKLYLGAPAPAQLTFSGRIRRAATVFLLFSLFLAVVGVSGFVRGKVSYDFWFLPWTFAIGFFGRVQGFTRTASAVVVSIALIGVAQWAINGSLFPELGWH